MKKSLRLRKWVNAFLPDAHASLGLHGESFYVSRALSESWGGLWVGGRVDISAQSLTFKPNQVNEVVHRELGPVHIALAEITGVEYVAGWITGTVKVKFQGGAFHFRCFGARKVVVELSQALALPWPSTP